ncbi:MAG: DNA polymerase/3'-5' exonuclease PolX [Anaerolineae bacterium]
MPVRNSEIADAFREFADLLEIEGANQFKVRAYRNAARTVEELPQSVRDMIEAGEDLTELSGIGEALAKKIKALVETGEIPQLQELRSRVPAGLAEMLRIQGLGPKRVQALHSELNVTTLDELRAAAERGEVASVSGLGEKTQETILEALEKLDETESRTRLDRAEQFVKPLVDYLKEDGNIERVEVAGSYRRRKETVGDLDILAISDAGEATVEHFVDYEDVSEVASQGETRSTVVLRSGLQVDLRVVPRESYGAALLYFTGSKAHNIALRNLALERGFKVNEYGVFKVQGDQESDGNGGSGERVAGETEPEIYKFFDLAYIEPEMRENRGEIEAAKTSDLPTLVTMDDIRGDLQTHTTASDGKATLAEMAQGAKERGYDYIAITDHSPNVAVTAGLDAEELAARLDEFDELNEKLDGVRVLKGIEVDILEDGSLDLPDDILERLDICVAAVHTYFNLSRDKQTERIIRALDNPNVDILVHPTGRRIGEREAYELDLERVMEAALERGCYLEINANPERLDLDDVHARMAKEMGLKLSISTDAHSVRTLDHMRFGVDQARRGWLTAEDVLNTRSWADLKRLLRD